MPFQSVDLWLYFKLGWTPVIDCRDKFCWRDHPFHTLPPCFSRQIVGVAICLWWGGWVIGFFDLSVRCHDLKICHGFCLCPVAMMSSSFLAKHNNFKYMNFIHLCMWSILEFICSTIGWLRGKLKTLLLIFFFQCGVLWVDFVVGGMLWPSFSTFSSSVSAQILASYSFSYNIE